MSQIPRTRGPALANPDIDADKRVAAADAALDLVNAEVAFMFVCEFDWPQAATPEQERALGEHFRVISNARAQFKARWQHLFYVERELDIAALRARSDGLPPPADAADQIGAGWRDAIAADPWLTRSQKDALLGATDPNNGNGRAFAAGLAGEPGVYHDCEPDYVVYHAGRRVREKAERAAAAERADYEDQFVGLVGARAPLTQQHAIESGLI